MTDTERLEELKRQLTLPIAANWDEKVSSECFDPWEVFDCFYGSYSSEFDDMAIEVLEAIQNRTSFVGEPLSHQMFREVLCRYNFCDYGISPRGCFPNWGSNFQDMLPTLIEKWKQYRAATWESET